MPAKVRQRTYFSNAYLDGASFDLGNEAVKGTAAGLSREAITAGIRRERINFQDVVVPVLATNDFGSIKLIDYPNGNLLLLGAVVALTAAAAGGITLASADIAVGTAAASAAVLATTMLDVVPKIDVTAGGVVAGRSTATEGLKYLVTSTSSLFLNVGGAVIATDGALTLNGHVDVIYVDLG